MAASFFACNGREQRAILSVTSARLVAEASTVLRIIGALESAVCVHWVQCHSLIIGLSQEKMCDERRRTEAFWERFSETTKKLQTAWRWLQSPVNAFALIFSL